ncbi:MAG: GHKL domain-containing protein [Clostridia bacterium]|nr:GHKL domain-containing protein [Clostridia bacterium]
MAFLATIYFIEIIIVFLFAKSIYEPKFNHLISFLGTLIAYSLLFIVNVVFKLEVLNILFMLLINILVLKLLYKSSLKSSLFHGLALMISVFISEFTVVYFSSLIIKESYMSSDNLHLQSLISMLLFFLITRVLARLSIKESNGAAWGTWVGLAVLPFSSAVVLFAFRFATKSIALQTVESICILIASIVLFLANVIAYVIYERAELNTQKLMELELANQKNEIDMQYLNLIEKKNQSMQVMAHDYKNHFITIASMTDSVEVKEYINGLLGETSRLDNMGKTQNRLLDVILSKYTAVCEEKDIAFEIDVVTDNLAIMNNNDISSLFNNLLDNAVESAGKSKDKKVLVQITNVMNSYRKIAVINSCDTPPNTKNGELVTSKENKDAHGFGTKSIKKIVNKYDGELDWEFDENAKVFKFTILIPINQ